MLYSDTLVILEFEPLAPRTWFRLGGPARFFCEVDGPVDMAEAIAWANEHGVPIRMLGRGANVLVADGGVDALVMAWKPSPARPIVVADADGVVTLSAGLDLINVAREASHSGLSGMEGLAGIPATIGGAIRMNAGGRFGDMASIVRSVDCLHLGGPHAGTVQRYAASECGFGYRASRLPGEIVVGAELQLQYADPRETWPRYRECLIHKRNTQPKMATHCAGCIFKNPTVGGQRISAGQLIDEAGGKGERFGSAVVSDQHANFIVAEGPDARADDVRQLIDNVRDLVHRVHGIELELEVDIWA